MTEQKTGATPSIVVRLSVLIAVAAAAIFLIVSKNSQNDEEPASSTATETTERRRPLLLDIGSDMCVPCKMMEPILEELTNDFKGKMDVRFINVRLNLEEAREYNIRVIPTQIFFDADGNEIYRHEGFFSREDIMKTWAEHGISFD